MGSIELCLGILLGKEEEVRAIEGSGILQQKEQSVQVSWGRRYILGGDSKEVAQKVRSQCLAAPSGT
jgi:hypothetical protein